MNILKSLFVFAAFVLAFAAFVFGLVGYWLNIAAIFAWVVVSNDVTLLLLFRVLGLFVAPIGILLGWFA